MDASASDLPGAPDSLAAFGTLLREHRLAAGLTQAALAERAGLSTRAVQHLERGLGQPYRATAQRLADVLALSGGLRSAFERAAAPSPRRAGARAPRGGVPIEHGREGSLDERLTQGLAARCTRCGQANPMGTELCLGCGDGALRAGADSAAGGAPPLALAPGQGIEGPAATSPPWEDERKQVTALFADIAGAPELLAEQDPEEARARLDPLRERLEQAVRQYGGTVTQAWAYGIAAVFGAPQAHEDHAVRACYAALRMREAVRQSAGVGTWPGAPPAIRVGLGSGEVVMCSAGPAQAPHHTAVGLAVQWARSMKEAAAADTILVSPATRHLLEGHVQLRFFGPAPVQGMAALATVHAVVDVAARPPRLRFSGTRGLTRFVGRQPELDRLLETFALGRAGRGQVVALLGEAGVGKTRLLWELTRALGPQDWLVLEGATLSYGQGAAYLPLIGLLKNYCQIEAGDDLRLVGEKLKSRVLALDQALQPALPALHALLDVPVDDPAWQALDDPQRRQRTIDACKRLLLRQSQVQPVLVVLEDLHWVDSATQAFLDALVESLPGARLVLVVSYRPEYQHSWGSRTHYTQVRLDPLPPASADELLRSLLGDDRSLQPLKPLIRAQTQGNPFCLEESVRMLVETEVLAGRSGAYRLAKSLESVPTPDTVHAMLAARIDRLRPEDKRLLQAAAVIGKDVPYPLLQAIAELPEDALRQGLARLQAAEFLYETSLFPDLEYTFKHALTHEVAYASLLQDRRRALHARIVTAIETLYPDRLAEQAERLAHHALRGEVWPAAWSYLRQAASRAAARSAHREAVAYFEQALDVAIRLPPDREGIDQAIDLRFDLCNSLQALAEMDRWVQHLHEAEQLAESLGDRRRLGWAYALLTGPSSERDAPAVAVGYGERGLAIAEKLNDLGMQIAARQQLGAAYRTLGNYARAVDLLRRNVAVLCGESVHQRFGLAGYPAVGSRSHLIRTLAECGEFAEAARRGEEALSIAQEKDFAFASIAALTSVSELCVNQGDWRRATALLDEARGRLEQHQIRFFLPMSNALLGYALVLGGRAREAVEYLESAAEQHSWGHGAAHTLWLGWLAEACLLAGERERAICLAERALHLARQRGERGREAYTLRLQAVIATSAEPPQVEQVERHYRQALALAEELGMRPLAAHCHLGLGAFYQKIGRDHDAQAELATAATMYRQMGMGFWLAKAEAAQAQTR